MKSPKFILTGAGGMLARGLASALETRDWPFTALTRADLDVTDGEAVYTAVSRDRPDVILHCAAYTRVDDAEHETGKAFEVNAESVRYVARAANEIGALLVYPGTDYVFDGEAKTPYPTYARTNPINAYGRSKLAGESAAREAARHLIVRLSWLYGSGGRNFVRTMATRFASGQTARVVDDQVGSPTAVGDAADLMLRLIEREATAGVYHVTNAGFCSWFDLARETARNLGVSPDVVTPCATGDFPTAARRPRYSVLDCSDTEVYTGPRRSWQTALSDAIRSGEY